MKSNKRHTLNPNIIAARYAVRGKTFLRAQEIKKKIDACKEKGEKNPYPFDQIVYCNIGNPQMCNQKPLTYLRQVITLCEDPSLMELTDRYPKDAIKHAQELIDAMGCDGTTGAYTHSKGLLYIRKNVCKFLKERDGVEVNPEDIFLTDGASTGIKMILNMVISHHLHGIMIPIPQYPLYSAAISQFGGTQVEYYLNEDNNWEIDMESVEKALNDALYNGISIKAFVAINPGNPTGQVMTVDCMKKLIEFCYKNRMILLADEVYQENIWGNVPFTSFRKVLEMMPEEIKTGLHLISFFSVSKGFYGECGKRGGFFEITNIGKFESAQMYKLASINLCSNVVGQLAVELIVNRPKPGDESYELFEKEKNQILGELKLKANIIYEALNKCEGIHCNPAMGALYLFPRIDMPQKFIDECDKNNLIPDEEYCIRMLEKTGICVVPGCGFGQLENTYHYRIAILPPLEQIQKTISSIQHFHEDFMKQYK